MRPQYANGFMRKQGIMAEDEADGMKTYNKM